MKKIILFLLIVGIVPSIYATNLEAYFMYSGFNSPNGPFIDACISTIGNSAIFVKNENGKFNAEIEVTLVFYKNSEVYTFRKYNLKSPEILDSTATKPNFIDVQRIPLANGIYNLELSIKDVHTETVPYMYSDIITIDYPEGAFKFSDMQFIESYKESTTSSVLTKNGYDLIPYISDFYPYNIDKLTFYLEMYNIKLKTTEPILLTYCIEKFENNEKIEMYSRFKKMEPADFNVFIGELMITELYSGNYNLVVEVRNRNNELIGSTKAFFQRSKRSPLDSDPNKSDNFDIKFSGITENYDTVRLYINSLRPLANNNECNFIDFQLKAADMQTMLNFFSSFWIKRAPADPNSEWVIYKAQVDYVNKWYSSRVKKGFETDRGRVYLKYGTPNDIYESKHEPTAYPYEIWTYYKIGDETNRKFIFYNPTIAGEDYELLHSDATGELRNPNWERLLNKRNNTIGNPDQLNSDDQWGGRAKDEYNKH